MGNALNSLPPKTAFWAGFAGGVGSLSTLGFIILLAIMVRGGLPLSAGDGPGGGGDGGTEVGQPSVGQPSGGTTPSIAALPALAQQLGLNEGQFKSCLDSGKYASKVRQQMTGGESAGINGTPGNIMVAKNGNKLLIPGAFPFQGTPERPGMKEAVDAMLLGNYPANREAAGMEVFSGTLPEVNADDHVAGNPASAKVVLIEYSDFECPFCQRFHPTMKQIRQTYGDQVAWVYRHFPLSNIHPSAQKLAEGSECAAELGGKEAFWKYADAVFGGA